METRDKLIFLFVTLSTMLLVVVNIFIGLTIYSQGNTLLHPTGSPKDLTTAIGYIVFIFGAIFLNLIVVLLNVFLLHYKIWSLQRDAYEYDELG